MLGVNSSVKEKSPKRIRGFFIVNLNFEEVDNLLLL